MPKELPKDWKTVSLGNLLEEDELELAWSIIERNRHQGFEKLEQALRRYFDELRPSLEAKGVLPEYLSHYLAYVITAANY